MEEIQFINGRWEITVFSESIHQNVKFISHRILKMRLKQDLVAAKIIANNIGSYIDLAKSHAKNCGIEIFRGEMIDPKCVDRWVLVCCYLFSGKRSCFGDFGMDFIDPMDQTKSSWGVTFFKYLPKDVMHDD